MSIATSVTIQGQSPPSLGGTYSLVDLFGTNLTPLRSSAGFFQRGTVLGYEPSAVDHEQFEGTKK